MSNFIVSARKYRPATFRSVVGQQHITSTLQNAIERGQLAHAYLFCGPRGVGKTTCARIFAKAINCLAPEGAEACNACESCRSFDEGRSMNIHELDAASNNSVEDIRTLIEQVRIVPQVGRYAVFIIDEVHMLSAAAFNAFLKTLEEPPAHAVFILATTEKHKIIPTILSRCQIYDFNRIGVGDAVGYLRHIATEEGIEADEESLNLIAQKADGGMRDALSMFDKAVSFCGPRLAYREVAATLNVLDYDTYFGMTELLLRGDYPAALLAYDDVLARGFQAQTFLAGFNRHMRDLLMAKRADTLRLIEMTGTLMERYRAQAEACTVEFLFGAIAQLTELDGRIRQSSSQRLLVELGLMKIAGLGQKKNDDPDLTLPELTTPAADRTAAAPAQPAKPEAPEPTTPNPSAPTAAAPQPAVPAPQAPKPSPAAESTALSDTTAASEEAGTTEPPASANEAKGAPPTQAVPEAQARPKAQTSPEEQTIPEAQARPEAQGVRTTQPVPETKAAAEAAAAPRSGRKPLISGTSLAELLSGTTDPAPEKKQDAPAEAHEVDPDCAAKIERARERILDLLRQWRPRFVAAFEPMVIEGNHLKVSVPTIELHDEIVRNRSSLLARIASLAGVKGRIELTVTVNEEIRATRPIRLEDRLRYITERNPLVARLRKELDLEAE